MELAQSLVKELIRLNVSMLPFAKEEAELKLKRYKKLKECLLEEGHIKQMPNGDYIGEQFAFSGLDYEIQLVLMELAWTWNANPGQMAQQLALVPELFENAFSKFSKEDKELAIKNFYMAFNDVSKRRQQDKSWDYQ